MNKKSETSEKNPAVSTSFSVPRAALFAISVSLFLIVFRPFSISIDSLAEALIFAGVAPLNFFAMFAIHRMPLADGPLRTIAGVLILVIVNSGYLVFWSGTDTLFSLVIQVALLVGLLMIGTGYWNRERTRYQAATETAFHETGSHQVVLRGQNDREILRLAPGELLYLSASGNYVDVYYEHNGESAKTMLRASLSGLVSQLSGVALQQCHRSFFVNVSAIQRIVSKRGRFEIELRHGLRVPVSRTFKEAVLASVSG